MNRADFIAAAAGLAGQSIIHPFSTAPYPHASRAGGHDYDRKHYDAATYYSDSSVGIFIPEGFRAQNGALDFVVHFHGWRNDVQHVLERYRLREQPAASKRNAILVVPQGPKDAPDSGDGKLELDSGGFARFMNDVASWLHTSGKTDSARVGRIVVSAHSGGYGGAGGALARGGMDANVTDVVLFDAAYGYFDAFAAWQKGAPDRHLLSLFTDDTSTGNTALMALVQSQQPNIYVRSADSMTLEELQTRAPTFVLTTSVAHDELMQKFNWYALFLQTTALTSVSGGV